MNNARKVSLFGASVDEPHGKKINLFAEGMSCQRLLPWGLARGWI